MSKVFRTTFEFAPMVHVTFEVLAEDELEAENKLVSSITNTSLAKIYSDQDTNWKVDDSPTKTPPTKTK